MLEEDAFFEGPDDATKEASNDDGAAPFAALCGLEVTKAGLGDVDKQKADRIIEEISKGSPFYLNQQRRSARVEARLAEMRVKWDRVQRDRQLLQCSLLQIDAELEGLELQRDLDRVVIHIDMDAFFAAVEMRDNPALAHVPMAVGSLGMLSTSNYAARKFGVRSAMPGYIARKLCPELVIVPVNFKKYSAVGAEIRKIFVEYDPYFRSVSCDEGCMDCTEYVRRRAEEGVSVSPAALAEEIRNRVFQQTSLTASAGVSVNRMLAKMCTDLNKPNGQFVLPPTRDAILEFLERSLVRKIPGVGKVTETLLRGLGVTTGRDVYDQRAALSQVMGPRTSQYLLHASRGLLCGDWGREEEHHRKSVSAERTFGRLHSVAELWAMCEKLSSAVAKELEEEGLQGRTVTVKMKRTTFEVRQRSVTLVSPTAALDVIHDTAMRILKQERTPLDLRLLGVRVSGFDHDEGDANHKHTLLSLFSPSALSAQPPAAQPFTTKDQCVALADPLRSSEGPIASEVVGETEEAHLAATVDGEQAALEAPPTSLRAEGRAPQPSSPQDCASLTSSPHWAPASASPALAQVLDPVLSQACPVCCNVLAKTVAQWQVHVDNCLSNQPSLRLGLAEGKKRLRPPVAPSRGEASKRRVGGSDTLTMRHFLSRMATHPAT